MGKNILLDYLKDHSSEVINMDMMMFNITTQELEAMAERNGRARGMAEGIAEGRVQGLLQTARQMKAKGFNATVISEITGLSEKEINECN